MKYSKYIATSFAAAAILAISAGSSLAAPAHATGNVNVRTGPGTSYHRVDTLHRGERVNVSRCQGGWCYITHSGPDGWVSARYLSQTGRPPVHREPSVNFSFQFGAPFGDRHPAPRRHTPTPPPGPHHGHHAPPPFHR